MATHPSLHAWEIPRTEEPSGLQLVHECSVMSNSLQPQRLQHQNQTPLSEGFSRQEYWSGLPFPTPGDLPDPRIEPASLTSPTLASRFFTTESPGKPFVKVIKVK